MHHRQLALPVRILTDVGRVWDFVAPPALLAALIAAAIDDLSHPSRLEWWIIDGGYHAWLMALMAIYSSRLFWLAFRTWKSPLTKHYRKWIVGWLFVLHPITIPAWQLHLARPIEADFSTANEASTASALKDAALRFHRTCCVGLAVYLVAVCLPLCTLYWLNWLR